MSSKGKKIKRKAKNCNEGKNKEVLTIKKMHVYFSDEEITEVKSILKTKDLAGVPFVVAATVLHKFDLLKKLLKDGYNINQTAQNNISALTWAVKNKFLDIVEFLLDNGADPTIKTESGDNLLIIALEHKSWDEKSFISLWKRIQKISFIDINCMSKNGHNMLHMCVRRDWEDVLVILLSEKPNVDAANANGVTPLMLACFRNNLGIIEALVNAGADILKEDNHGRMTLCYAITTAMKLPNPSNLVTQKMLEELQKQSSLENYLKRRLDLVILAGRRSEISSSISDMLIKIIQFTIEFTEDGLEILLESKIFTQLAEVLTTGPGPEIVDFLLEIANRVLFYNEDCRGFRVELQKRVTEDFSKSDLVKFCCDCLIRKDSEISKKVFRTLILSYNEKWSEVFRENTKILLPILRSKKNFDDDIQNLTQSKIFQKKLAEVRNFFHNLDATKTVNEESENKKKPDTVNSKKTRRRSKAIKAKLTKIKSAELTKRLNLTAKPKISPKTISTTPVEVSENQNPIAISLQNFLQNSEKPSKKLTKNKENDPEWKKLVLDLPFTDSGRTNVGFSVNSEDLLTSVDCLRKASENVQKCDRNVGRSLNVIVDYLRQLVQMIVKKYREHWGNDRSMGVCSCKDISEHVPWLYSEHVQNLEAREKVIIKELQGNFDKLVRAIKELVHKNLPECYKNINKIESILLNYEIRGIKTMSYVANSETLTMKYKGEKATVNTITGHAENILNNLEQQRDDVEIEMLYGVDNATFTEECNSESPEELYRKEMSEISYPKPKNKRNDIEAKLNTIANGFHLINSTMAICDDDDEKIERIYGISDLTPFTKANYATSTPKQCSEISEYIPNRLKSQIASLQSMKTFQNLLAGEIRICTKEKRINYIISAGVNFNAVELGLDLNNQPMAVKRTQKESWVGKIIKTLVEPLLGLVDSHILHYFACEYERDELILATPLCKWNMSQYVQLIRQSNATIMPALTAMQIIKQFLNGLTVLHKCEIPIVHGNLKPSNIFIDFNGMVKIAEFGIHKALYKIIEAPKTSLMWFAKETLDIYQNSSIVECTLMSDIQVTGMVLYFILTCGKHPFGDEIEDILSNIQRGITKLNMRNQDLKDLLLWMMLNDPEERPTIDQVMSHTVFWSSVKKWRFVLCCAGVTQNGYPIPLNIEKLHRSIDTLSLVEIDWHNIIRSKLPNAVINENNNLVGLLKFIKNCYDHQPEICDLQLNCWVLTAFPSLPVTLLRTLQNSNWLKHGVFLPFSIGSSLF